MNCTGSRIQSRVWAIAGRRGPGGNPIELLVINSYDYSSVYDRLPQRLGAPLCDAAAVSSRAWAAFATVSVLWGIPYLFIKVAVDDGLPPGFIAWSRVTLAAVVLLGLAWRAGRLRALRGRRPLARPVRAARDLDPVPADRRRREARVVVARGDRDRHRPADRGAARPALRCRGARLRPAAGRAARGLRRRGRPRGRRPCGQRDGAARSRGRRAGRRGLRGRADDPEAPPRRPRPARDDGRVARDRGRDPHPGRGARHALAERSARTRSSLWWCSGCSARPRRSW